MIFKETLALNAKAARTAVWRALWERVENPARFLAALESFAIVEQKADAIYRRLHFSGGVVVRDIVRWENEKWLSFDVIPSGEHISGNLKIEIEGDENSGFSLTFTYETTDHSAEDAHLAEYVKSAYHHANLDHIAHLESLLK